MIEDIKKNLVAILVLGSIVLGFAAWALISNQATPRIAVATPAPAATSGPDRDGAISACMVAADRRWRIGIENFDRMDSAGVVRKGNVFAVAYAWDQGSRRFSCVVEYDSDGNWRALALERTN